MNLFVQHNWTWIPLDILYILSYVLKLLRLERHKSEPMARNIHIALPPAKAETSRCYNLKKNI